MNGEEAIEAVASARSLHFDDGSTFGLNGICSEARDELVRRARIGLEAERRSTEPEARCIACVATVGRTIRDDKATISLYNTDGEVKFLVETPGGLAFKGRAGELLDALDNCIDEGWCP